MNTKSLRLQQLQPITLGLFFYELPISTPHVVCHCWNRTDDFVDNIQASSPSGRWINSTARRLVEANPNKPHVLLAVGFIAFWISVSTRDDKLFEPRVSQPSDDIDEMRLKSSFKKRKAKLDGRVVQWRRFCRSNNLGGSKDLTQWKKIRCEIKRALHPADATLIRLESEEFEFRLYAIFSAKVNLFCGTQKSVLFADFQ